MSTTGLALSSHAVDIDQSGIEAFHTRHPVKRGDHAFRWRAGLVLEVIVILVLWEFLVTGLKVVPPAFLPPPSAISSSFVDLVSSASFLDHLQYSVTNLVVGVLIASIVGISVGLVVGWSRFLEVTVAPLIWTIYSIPKVALTPLIILGLGLGPQAVILLVFLMGVFPVVLNTIDGVQTVDPSLVRAGRVFGGRGISFGRKVVLPATLPFILVGVRRAIALGFVAVILGEFMGGSKGIGHLLQRATTQFRMDDALAIVVIMVIFANIGLITLDVIRRRAAPWHNEGPVAA